MIKNRRGVLSTLTGMGTVAALVMSAIALANSSRGDGRTATPPLAKAVVAAGAAHAAGMAAAATAPATVLDVTISPDSKLGPDGKKHDAYSQTEFAVRVGRPLTLRIDNTDNQPHSITAPQAGVDIIAMPGTHTYTLLVKAAGRFHWRCMVMCDTGASGWAMTHIGYMSGFITAT